MQCVKVPFLLSQGISCLTTCFYKSEVFRQSLRALSKKKDCKSVKAVELVFGQLKVAGGPDFFCSPPSHLGLSSINRSRSSERFCHWSTLKYTETSFGGSVPLSGPTKYRCQNAGTVLPLPGNRVGVARSVERDAVWWIGFSWSFECKIPPPPPPVEELNFQQQSHATGLDHARFCQIGVLTAIFLVRLMEKTRAVKRKKVIHSSSLRCWAEVCTCFTSRCLCSLCTFAVVGLSICASFFFFF